ncbi:hypothetical protein [Phenylobacterium montanum]|uniref:Uncharacterized protein n=1 Tax=Phenylobacterium montanum TaxID=2823693 RepID=A0A975FYD0_9CAUL|nr:hypothetical protein [Caulobacter sp. S6]QUD87733.1 hypothetical protein KCG34_22240 [Caulobacter sp. S6]
MAAPALAAQPASQPAAQAPAEDDDGVPPSAPKDDYRFVAWCYGALDEYLQIYDQVKPDLKAIDKMFGSPVKEDEPYHDDVAEDRKALKRFGQAIEAAEKASLHPISPQGAAAMQSGRDIWSAAKLQPSRKLADAWLFWGLPNRCDIVAKQLKVRATLMGQAFAIEAPKADAAPAADPPPASAAPASEPPAAPDAPPAPSVTEPGPLKGPQ